MIVCAVVIEEYYSVCSEGIHNQKHGPFNLEIVPMFAIFVISCEDCKFDCLDNFFSFA